MTGVPESSVARRASTAQGAGPALRALPREGGEALWLTRSRWPLFAWVHEPQVRARGAVVVCPPLLGEHLAAYDLQRATAAALAACGILTVRFDYEGTGDSGGPAGGPGRLQAWLDGVEQAVQVARDRCAGPLALLGVRSGALVAALAADRRRDVDALVLWDPWSTGRSFLRRQQALHALHRDDAPPSGVVEVPGFVVDGPTADAIRGLRLPPTVHVRRALVVRRPGVAAPAVALAAHPGPAGRPAPAEMVESVPGEQEACFDVEPLHRRLPIHTAASVVAWVEGTVAQLGTPAPRPVPARSAAGAGDATRHRQPGSQAVRIPPSTAGGVTVYERSVELGPHHIFGVETVTRAHTREVPTVLFLSSGTDSHVGPSRVWVDLARRFAATGVRSIRVDLSGWGESAPRPGRPALVLRAPEAFDDVAEVVDAVGGPEKTVLVGLCSGAYQALESALELRPLAVLGVNPILRFTPPELADGAIDPRRRLCEPRQPWVPTLRDRLPRWLTRTAVWARRSWRRRRSAAQDAKWLGELAGAGVHVYLVCGDEEAKAIPAVWAADATGAPPGAGDAARVDVIGTLDHALTVSSQREDVFERLTAALSRVLSPSAASPSRRGASAAAPKGEEGDGGDDRREPSVSEERR